MSQALPNLSPSKQKRWRKRLAYATGSVAIFLATAYGLLRWYASYLYPYGSSHCCILNLGLELNHYADAHDGFFPHGQPTPEASLSLLAHDKTIHVELGSIVELLRGKTVPAEKVRDRLAAGKLLGPTTCGWYYVEGLSLRDDPELAIVWDKVGLGHNGERLPRGGHEVLFVSGSRVRNKDWRIAARKRLAMVSNQVIRAE